MPMPFLECAILICFRERLFLGVIVRNFQGAVQQSSQIDWLGYDLLRCSVLPRLQKISAANLDGRKADGLRDAVHVPLHGEQALGRAKAAERAMRRARWWRLLSR